MSELRNCLREWLLTAAFLVLVVISLPLLVFLAFLGRMVLVAAAVAALVGGVALLLVNPRFRHWVRAQTALQTSYKGLHLDADVGLHPGHCWARVDPDEVVVGADDLVQTVLGPVESVEFPALGRRVERGDHLVVLRRGDRSLELPAPVSGTVISQNNALRERPWLVNQAPFSRGWVLRLRGDRPWTDRRRLLRGGKAQAWFHREVDRLISLLLPGGLSEKDLISVLPDDGSLVEGLYRQIDDEAWERLKEAFFTPEGSMARS